MKRLLSKCCLRPFPSEDQAYSTYSRRMETSHMDNMTILRAIIRPVNDQKPLYHGSKRTKESLEVLKLKSVLLLFTELDMPQEYHLKMLRSVYEKDTSMREYEVLWLPIVVDSAKRCMTISSNEREAKFYVLRNNMMPWYSVDHYSLVEPLAVRYIREVWNFVQNPVVVVLDPQGKPSNLDALPMIWVWGPDSFPFTKAREKELWAEYNTWNMLLLADAIDSRIPEWIEDNKVICVYGGEDIDWIRKFTANARRVANALQVNLEMLYVGKSNPSDKVRQCNEIIAKEELSHTFPLQECYDTTSYFWIRLRSMWNSKKNIDINVDGDKLMQEINDVLSFDRSEQGWAIFSRGNYEMTKAKWELLIPILDNYKNWENKVQHPEQFVRVLDDEMYKTTYHCMVFLPGDAREITETVVCYECGRMMEKFIMFRCDPNCYSLDEQMVPDGVAAHCNRVILAALNIAGRDFHRTVVCSECRRTMAKYILFRCLKDRCNIRPSIHPPII